MSKDSKLDFFREYSFLQFAIFMGFLLSFSASLIVGLFFNYADEENFGTYLIIIVAFIFLLIYSTYKSFNARWGGHMLPMKDRIYLERTTKTLLLERLNNFQNKTKNPYEIYENMYWLTYFNNFFNIFIYLILTFLIFAVYSEVGYLRLFPISIFILFLIMYYYKTKILNNIKRWYILREKLGKWNPLYYISLIFILLIVWAYLTTNSSIDSKPLLFISFILVSLLLIVPRKSREENNNPKVMYHIWKKFGFFENRRYILVFEFLEDSGKLYIDNYGFDKITEELQEQIKETIKNLGSDIEEKITELQKIKCPVCGHKNPKDSKYCLNCGKKLKLTICSNCGFENPENAKYCGNCGTSLFGNN